MFVSGLLYLFYHNKPDYTSTFFELDTIVSVRSDTDCREEIKVLVKKLSSVLDNYDENSEISSLNSSGKMICSDDLTDFLKNVESLNSKFGYSTDISSGNLNRLWKTSLESGKIPDFSEISRFLENSAQKNIFITGNLVELKNGVSIDTGAVAKGYILDRIYSQCINPDSRYTIVSTGSTTLLYSADSSRIFNCAVKSDCSGIAGTAEVTSCFVSTSGDYERFTEINGVKYHHIIDMKTGYPSDTGLSSVTVFCDSGIMSDFLSTLIFTEGKENLGRYLDSDDFRIIAIDKQGNIYRSPSLIFHES